MAAGAGNRRRRPCGSAGGYFLALTSLGPILTPAGSLRARRLDAVDDRFIPVRASLLQEAIAGDASLGAWRREMGAVAARLRDVVEAEAAPLRRTLEDLYAPFDPDGATVGCAPGGPPGDDAWRGLCDHLLYLLEKANFERLDEVQIRRAVAQANHHGVKVQLRAEMIRELSVWVRGRTSEARRYRTWRRPIKGEERRVEVFRLVAVVARPADDGEVYLKLFRDIPLVDLEALLPHAEIRMNWFDRVKVAGGAGGAIGTTALKLSKIMAATVVAWTALLWVVAAGLAVLAARSFFGYKAARATRDSRLTRHLYYQNLANNAAVVHSLVTMVAQEELKEAILGYALARAAQDDSTEGQALALRAELGPRVRGWLRRRFGVEMDFDCRDAIETLERLGLWRGEGAEVAEVGAALASLERYLSRGEAAAYHLRAVAGQGGQAGPRRGAEPAAEGQSPVGAA